MCYTTEDEHTSVATDWRRLLHVLEWLMCVFFFFIILLCRIMFNTFYSVWSRFHLPSVRPSSYPLYLLDIEDKAATYHVLLQIYREYIHVMNNLWGEKKNDMQCLILTTSFESYLLLFFFCFLIQLIKFDVTKADVSSLSLTSQKIIIIKSLVFIGV